MKIYLAGPLFTVVELDFNRRLKAVLEASGHAVWLPQEHTPKHGDAHGILAVLLDGLRHADVVVANMDGADPDSGTSWECGYACACGVPTILFRTDTRARLDVALGPYNLMMWASATVRLDGPFGSIDELTAALLSSLDPVLLKTQVEQQRSRIPAARTIT
ncbi:MAG: nucleoside 2-deoxyribosyltransferase [Xanthobacteraceae bacterium]